MMTIPGAADLLGSSGAGSLTAMSRELIGPFEGAVTPQPLLDFQAGYVLRSIDDFPRAGSRAPWRLGMSYAHDVITLRHGKIDDGSMRFERAVTPSVR